MTPFVWGVASLMFDKKVILDQKRTHAFNTNQVTNAGYTVWLIRSGALLMRGQIACKWSMI